MAYIVYDASLKFCEMTPQICYHSNHEITSCPAKHLGRMLSLLRQLDINMTS